MNNTRFLFEWTPWWLLVGVVIAFALGFLVYTKKDQPWGLRTSLVLGTLRGMAFVLVFLLLLNPFINQITNENEKPIIALAIDNSLSVVEEFDSLELVKLVSEIADNLDNGDLELKTYDLNGMAETVLFDNLSSNINGMLSAIYEDNRNKNLGAVVLLSDGIYNQGSSPAYRNRVIPAITVGVGDTIAKRDLKIVDVNVNRVVYQGNRFTVDVTVDGMQFAGQSTQVNISDRNVLLQSQDITLSSLPDQVQFILDANEPGLKRYTVSVATLPGDFTIQNNSRSFYVDVIEGKEKVLVVAAAPHPDIRAIRMTIDKGQNYETDLHIPGVAQMDPNSEYDVVIVHGAFDRFTPNVTVKGDPAYWYIAGNNPNIDQLAAASGVSITLGQSRRDMVGASLGSAFTRFELNKEYADRMDDYPPVEVPFGDYALAGTVETLLYQRVGSLTTGKPLLCFMDNGETRSALLLGMGIWRWRLQENALHDSQDQFDQLVLRTVQYLSVRNDKRKFIFEPERSEFPTGQPVTFRSESYNDVYERTGGNTIELQLVDEESNTLSYQFTANGFSDNYTTQSLPAGIYKYRASTEINGIKHSAKGEFAVKDLNLEMINLTADHQLLRRVAENSGGTYLHYSEVDQLPGIIEELGLKSIIHSTEDYLGMINMWWLLFLIVALFTAEWFTRKYLGSY